MASSGWPGWTTCPTSTVFLLTTPSTGALIVVYWRFSCACSTVGRQLRTLAGRSGLGAAHGHLLRRGLGRPQVGLRLRQRGLGLRTWLSATGTPCSASATAACAASTAARGGFASGPTRRTAAARSRPCRRAASSAPGSAAPGCCALRLAQPRLRWPSCARAASTSFRAAACRPAPPPRSPQRASWLAVVVVVIGTPVSPPARGARRFGSRPGRAPAPPGSPSGRSRPARAGLHVLVVVHMDRHHRPAHPGAIGVMCPSICASSVVSRTE